MLHSLLFVLLVMGVVGALEVRRPPTRVAAHEYTLDFSRLLRVGTVLVLVCVPPVLLAFLHLRFPGPWTSRNEHLGTALRLGSIFLGAWLYLVTTRRYRLDGRGLVVQQFAGADERFTWSALSDARVEPLLLALELDFGGRRVLLSRYLTGFDALASTLFRLAPEVLDRFYQIHAYLGHVPAARSAPVQPRGPPPAATPPDAVDARRDESGLGYDTLTLVFDPAFTRQVASWPIVCVLPLGAASEAGQAPLAPVLAALLRRDLGLAGPVSVPDTGEEGGVTFTELLAQVGEEDLGEMVWQYVAAVGHELQGTELVLQGRLWKLHPGEKPRELQVRGPPDSVGELTAPKSAPSHSFLSVSTVLSGSATPVCLNVSNPVPEVIVTDRIRSPNASTVRKLFPFPSSRSNVWLPVRLPTTVTCAVWSGS